MFCAFVGYSKTPQSSQSRGFPRHFGAFFVVRAVYRTCPFTDLKWTKSGNPLSAKRLSDIIPFSTVTRPQNKRKPHGNWTSASFYLRKKCCI
jgi:hypothetical protein